MGTARDNLLELAKLRTEDVEVGGHTFTVREMSVGMAAQYSALTGLDKDGAMALLLQTCVLDEAGLPALTRDESRSIAQSSRVSIPLIATILKLSGMGEDLEKKADAS